jgi:hypothetical protein
VLEVLSRILPDSVWLESVALEGRELTVSGYAEDAAEVVPTVESSAHFSGVEFGRPARGSRCPAPAAATATWSGSRWAPRSSRSGSRSRDRAPLRAGRRALALGLLAAVVLLGRRGGGGAGLAGLPPADGARRLERRIVDLRRRLPAREGLIAEERLLGRADALERALLRGSTPALAAAALQGDLTALASAMGAVVTSVQILDAEPAPPFTDVGLRLTMVSDVSTLRDFLYAVETREPVMLLRSFSLGRADGGSAASRCPAGPSRSPRRSRSAATSPGWRPGPRRPPAAGSGPPAVAGRHRSVVGVAPLTVPERSRP